MAFTVEGPSSAFRVGVLVVEFVLALGFDGRATVCVNLTLFAARLHTVGKHIIAVLFALAGSGPLRASDTGTLSVGNTLVLSVFFGTGSSAKSVFTSTDRAARSGAVGKHPVGVGNTLTGTGPRDTETIAITAEGSVSDTELGLFITGGFESGVFFDHTESVSSAGQSKFVVLFGVEGSFAFLGVGGSLRALEFVFGTVFAFTAVAVYGQGHSQHTC